MSAPELGNGTQAPAAELTPQEHAEIGARSMLPILPRDAGELDAWDRFAAAATIAAGAGVGFEPASRAELAARVADALMLARRARAPGKR